MKPHPRQFVASLLAIAYSAIAIAGHGLHALAPCGDVNCAAEKCQVACDCGVAHTLRAVNGQSNRASQWPSLQDPSNDSQHDPHTCAFCTVLAKVKVGHSVATGLQHGDELVAATALAVASSPYTIRDFSNAPRGPPLSIS